MPRGNGKITIMVGEIGTSPVTLLIKKGSTIKSVLHEAGSSATGDIRLDGKVVKMSHKVTKANCYLAVAPKVKGA